MIKNNKGFTLVELLATISILAIIMLMAIPNVIGIVQRNKNKTYVEDAKKMITLAQYKIRTDTTAKPKNGQTACLYLSYLDASEEISEAPNGGKYNQSLSYVKIVKSGTKYTYSVQLIETKDGKTSGSFNGQSNSAYAGLSLMTETEVYSDDATKKAKSSDVATTACTASTTALSKK